MSADNNLFETNIYGKIPGIINKNLTVPQECKFGENIVIMPLTTFHIMKICGITLNSQGNSPIKVKVFYEKGDTYLHTNVFASKNSNAISKLIDDKSKEIVDFFSKPEHQSIVQTINYILDINKIKGEITKKISELTNTSNDEGDFRIRYTNANRKTEIEIIPHLSHVDIFSLENIRKKIGDILNDPEYALRRESNASVIFDIPNVDGNEFITFDTIVKLVIPELKIHFNTIKYFETKSAEEGICIIKIFDKSNVSRSMVEELSVAILKKTGIVVRGYIHEDFKFRFTHEKEQFEVKNHESIHEDEDEDERLSVCSELMRTSSPSRISYADALRGSSCSPAKILKSDSPLLCKSPLCKSTNWFDQIQETEEENSMEEEALKFNNSVETTENIIKPSTTFLPEATASKIDTHEISEEKPVESIERNVNTDDSVKKEMKLKSFKKMTPEEVAEKIGNIGENYKPYRDIFIANALDGEFLSSMDVEYLKKELIELGIRNIHATRIVHGIGQWICNES